MQRGISYLNGSLQVLIYRNKCSLTQQTSTRATLSAGNISIGGKASSVEELGIHSDPASAHQQLAGLPDLQAVLEKQKTVAQATGTIASAVRAFNSDRVKAAEKEKAEAQADLQAALQSNDHNRIATAKQQYQQAEQTAKDWGIGGGNSRALNAVTTAITGALGGQSGLQVATNTLAPYAAETIGNTFGHNGSDPNKTAQLFSHAVLGATLAYVNGGNAATGAVAGAGSEAAAIYLTQTLYKDKATDPATGKLDPNRLPEKDKAHIRSLTAAIGAVAGGIAGDSALNAQIAGVVGQNAVENNYLTKSKMNEVKDCLTGKTCSSKAQQERVLKDAEKLSQFLDQEVGNICAKNPLSDACRTGVSAQIQYVAMMDAWAYMNGDVRRSSKQTFDHLYNSDGASSRFVNYFNTIDNRANFFGASNMYEKHMGSGAKWFDGAEYVSRAPITGLGADGKASYLTFGAGKVLGNPDIYGWRKEAGDTLITKGFDNFKGLYNNRPDAMKWDIKQLQDEQKLLQSIHEKYLSSQSWFRGTSKLLTGVEILDYKSRIEYGCKLLGYSQEQGCKP